MPRSYDENTQKFMEDVAKATPPTSSSPDSSVVKQTVSVAKALLGDNPKAGLAKFVVRKGVGALAREGFDKSSADEQPRHATDIISVYKQLNDKYGTEWYDWEPETVEQTLDHDYGLDINIDGKDVVGALQLLLNTNQAHENWHIFEKVGHAFNGNHVDFSIIQPLRPDEIALTLAIINAIRPQEVYEKEIAAYIAASGKESGLVYLPPEFFGEDAQAFLDEFNNDIELKNAVKLNWSKGKTSAEDNVMDIQLKSLQEIKNYLGEHYGIS